MLTDVVVIDRFNCNFSRKNVHFSDHFNYYMDIFKVMYILAYISILQFAILNKNACEQLHVNNILDRNNICQARLFVITYMKYSKLVLITDLIPSVLLSN